MSIVSFITDKILPLIGKIAPHSAEEIKVEFAVRAERGHRPFPFSLWTGMDMGPPPEGPTALTAAPRSSSAPIAPTPPATPFAASNYVSWPGLADRSYTGRHLPPADPAYVASLPPIGEVVDRVYLRQGPMIPCPQTSTLFCFFAQWFTDSFLRTDPRDRRRNTSNHEIDFCQIYGLDERTALGLRERAGGRMRLENNLLPRLTLPNGQARPEFADLCSLRDDPTGTRLRAALGQSLPAAATGARWTRMYATGLERGNSTILYTALSTMFLREHNVLARTLATMHADWDDDRLFETTRIVMIHNVLQIVVEDYINHLAGGFDFHLDPSFAERQSWYRTNRISIEFNLLYRWHSLVPDTLNIGHHVVAAEDYRFNNALLESTGVEHAINAASTQHAGRIGLYNTPTFLAPAEQRALQLSRDFQMMPFVDYCDHFSHPRPASIAALVGGDARAAAHLTQLYGTIDRVELPVGLLAEARSPGSLDAVLPPLVRTMVAVDAFTHILTNPLLAQGVDAAAFQGARDDVGALIQNTGGVAGAMRRAAAPGTAPNPSFKVRAPLPTD
jgi:prostaglandin-endoperoxide synthase 2